MGRLKYFTRGLVMVSAATCWFLGAAQPTLASTLILRTGPTLTAAPTSAYPGDLIKVSGNYFSQCERHNTDVQVLPGPGLQRSSNEAAAGGSVTVAGTGFGRCPGKELGDYVQLLWDTAPLGRPVGLDGNGAFGVDVTVPAAATTGSGHMVAAECYDSATESATSGVLARQPFSVTPPTSPTSPASTPPDVAPANARTHSRPGSAPLSIGLEPHPDRLGHQQVKEKTP